MIDGRLWGFACKVTHGDHPQSLWDAFEKGLSQIEASKADTGLVVVSFKNKLPHDEFFPILGKDSDGDATFGALPSEHAATMAVWKFIDDRVRAMVAHVTKSEIQRRLEGSRAMPALGSPVESAVAVRFGRSVYPSLVSNLQTWTMETGPNRRFDASAESVTAAINLGLVAGRTPPHTAL